MILRCPKVEPIAKYPNLQTCDSTFPRHFRFIITYDSGHLYYLRDLSGRLSNFRTGLCEGYDFGFRQERETYKVHKMNHPILFV